MKILKRLGACLLSAAMLFQSGSGGSSSLNKTFQPIPVSAETTRPSFEGHEQGINGRYYGKTGGGDVQNRYTLDLKVRVNKDGKDVWVPYDAFASDAPDLKNGTGAEVKITMEMADHASVFEVDLGDFEPKGVELGTHYKMIDESTGTPIEGAYVVYRQDPNSGRYYIEGHWDPEDDQFSRTINIELGGSLNLKPSDNQQGDHFIIDSIEIPYTPDYSDASIKVEKTGTDKDGPVLKRDHNGKYYLEYKVTNTFKDGIFPNPVLNDYFEAPDESFLSEIDGLSFGDIEVFYEWGNNSPNTGIKQENVKIKEPRNKFPLEFEHTFYDGDIITYTYKVYIEPTGQDFSQILLSEKVIKNVAEASCGDIEGRSEYSKTFGNYIHKSGDYFKGTNGNPDTITWYITFDANDFIQFLKGVLGGPFSNLDPNDEFYKKVRELYTPEQLENILKPYNISPYITDKNLSDSGWEFDDDQSEKKIYIFDEGWEDRGEGRFRYKITSTVTDAQKSEFTNVASSDLGEGTGKTSRFKAGVEKKASKNAIDFDDYSISWTILIDIPPESSGVDEILVEELAQDVIEDGKTIYEQKALVESLVIKVGDKEYPYGSPEFSQYVQFSKDNIDSTGRFLTGFTLLKGIWEGADPLSEKIVVTLKTQFFDGDDPTVEALYPPYSYYNKAKIQWLVDHKQIDVAESTGSLSDRRENLPRAVVKSNYYEGNYDDETEEAKQENDRKYRYSAQPVSDYFHSDPHYVSIYFQIDFNPEREDLLGERDKLELLDEMGMDLTLILDSIRITEILPDSKEETLKLGTDYTYIYSPEENKITFDLPNRKHLIITYWATVSPENAKLDAKNIVKIIGRSSDSAMTKPDETEAKKHTITVSSEVTSFTVNKLNENNSPLAGANFRLTQLKYIDNGPNLEYLANDTYVPGLPDANKQSIKKTDNKIVWKLTDIPDAGSTEGEQSLFSGAMLLNVEVMAEKNQTSIQYGGAHLEVKTSSNKESSESNTIKNPLNSEETPATSVDLESGEADKEENNEEVFVSVEEVKINGEDVNGQLNRDNSWSWPYVHNNDIITYQINWATTYKGEISVSSLIPEGTEFVSAEIVNRGFVNDPSNRNTKPKLSAVYEPIESDFSVFKFGKLPTGGIFKLQEVSIPDGYQGIDTQYFAFMGYDEKYQYTGNRFNLQQIEEKLQEYNEAINIIKNMKASENVKNYLLGNLIIKKTVNGRDADQEEDFTFKVTLKNDGKPVSGSFKILDSLDPGAEKTVYFNENGEGSISLKHDQTIIFKGLPEGTTYSVEETENNNYTQEGKNTDGQVSIGSTATAEFINTRNTGDLEVGKEVTGTDGEENRPFTFTVTLMNEDDSIAENINGQYGEMEFSNGVSTFTLVSGQSKKATELPTGYKYLVTEKEANQDDYQTSVKEDYSGSEGNITKDEEILVVFVNHREKPSESFSIIPEAGGNEAIILFAIGGVMLLAAGVFIVLRKIKE